MALAAAIVLPMVMDGEPKPSGNELQIRIPSQEGSNFTARTLKTPDSPVAAASLPQANQSKPVSPSVSNSVVPAAKDVLVAKSRPEPVLQSSPEPRKPKASGQGAVKPLSSTTETVSSKKVETKPREDARALAILDDRPGAIPQNDKPEVFYVQLGVYRDADNAKEVQAKAASHGVKSVLRKVGVNTRVRSGPFSDRASAEALVAKLKQAGLSGFVATK